MRLRCASRAAVPPRLLFVVATLRPAPVSAQGGNVDIISGTVIDPAGKPVPNAQIEALSIETDVTRRTQTDAKGHYILFFNDGGGQYRVTARAIGHSPFIQNVSRQAAGPKGVAFRDRNMTHASLRSA